MSGSLDLSEFQDQLTPVGQPPLRDPWAIPGQRQRPGSASSTMPGVERPSPPSAGISPVVWLVVGLVGLAVAFVGIRGLLDGLTITRDEACAAWVQDAVDVAEARDLPFVQALLADDFRWDGVDPAGEGRQDVALAALLAQIEQAQVVSIDLNVLEQTVTPRTAHVSAGLVIVLRTEDGTRRHKADLDAWLGAEGDSWRLSSLGVSDIR